MAQSIQRESAFLRRKQVETRTGLSRSTIYQTIKDGVFPKPVPLGPRAVGWLESADFSLRQRVDRRSGEDRPGRRPAGGVTTRMHGCRMGIGESDICLLSLYSIYYVYRQYR